MFRNNFWRKIILLNNILIDFWEGVDLAWGPSRRPHGAGGPSGEGAVPPSYGTRSGGGRRGEWGLRVPAGLRFPFYVENKRQE